MKQLVTLVLLERHREFLLQNEREGLEYLDSRIPHLHSKEKEEALEFRAVLLQRIAKLSEEGWAVNQLALAQLVEHHQFGDATPN